MSKGKVFLIIGIVFFAGIAAGFFNFAEYVKIPYIPQKPFSLGLDLQGGVQLIYKADLSQLPSSDYDSAMGSLRDAIEKRVNVFGVKEPVVQVGGKGNDRRLTVELAGVIDPGQAIALLQGAPFLEFREQKENFEEIIKNNPPTEDPFKPTALTGAYLKKAALEFDSFNQPMITLQFNDEGAKIFEDMTSRNIGKEIWIFLDYQVLQHPVVNSAIPGGRAQITGGFKIKEAQQIVRSLNAGALPVPISLISQQQVGATLGSISLEKSLKAGLLGLIGVIVFLVIFYRVPGVLAALSLLLYSMFLLFLFKIIPVTLTLSGMAGFILSIGMAVDVNVLIFSRMREELKAGRSFSQGIEEGFRRAWPSIRDGHLTTLFVSLILFWFGSSFVQGFALTLALGILLSMFTGIIVTRNLLRVFVGTPLEKIKFLWA